MRFRLIVYSVLSSLLLLAGTKASAQGRSMEQAPPPMYVIMGQVQTPQAKPLFAASVQLYTVNGLKDSLIKSLSTDSNGRFKCFGLSPISYKLIITHPQYESINRSVVLSQDQPMQRLSIQMINKVQDIKGAGVVLKKDAVTQKNDTVEYNASQFKVTKDATVENLITKMPGISNENGVLKAQGEEVKKVTVDGQDFFGQDASAAVKNLPAEVVDKVQVYDRLSDQAQFTGINDGNSTKTLNIVTKSGKNNGQFGKLYGGSGTDERYATGGNFNIFRGKQRLSVIGMSNNINQQNFSSQDIIGLTGNTGGGMGGMGGGRGPGGGSWGGGNWGGGNQNFSVNQQGGINQTHGLGLNYSTYGGKKYKLSASYFFNQVDNNTASFLDRTYFLSASRNQYYNQADTGNSRSINHKISMRWEYNLDTNNSIIFTPNINLQKSNNNSLFLGQTNSQETALINLSKSLNSSDGSGYNISQNTLLRHKFKKAGQTISLNLSTTNTKNLSNALLNANNQYFLPDTSADVFKQNTDRNSTTFNFSPNLSYTQQLSKLSAIEVNYNPSFNRNYSDKQTAKSDTNNQYTLTDSLLSNTFNNNSSTQKAGATYRFNKPKFGFNLGANVQSVNLKGEQVFPKQYGIDQVFNNVLPNAQLTFTPNKNLFLRIHYRSSTDLPSITQLQNVLNNSNPLLLSTGNAALEQSFTNMVHLRFSKSNPAKSRNAFMYGNITLTNQYIGNSSQIALKDTVINQVSVKKGAQLSMPVNLNGYESYRLYYSYGLPIKFIKSTLNMNLGQNYSKTPSLINGQVNSSNNYGANAGITIASNISEWIDYSVNYTANYNSVKNSLQSQLDNRYWIQNLNAKINWIVKKKIVLNVDVTNSAFKGLGSAFNQSIWLFNGGVGYKFLKDNRGELKCSVFDALKQNTSIARTVSDTYIEDKNTKILTRFYMLTFTYSIRHFKLKPNTIKK
jgi:hypothetical protein